MTRFLTVLCVIMTLSCGGAGFASTDLMTPSLNCDLILRSIKTNYGSTPVYAGLATGWTYVKEGQARVNLKAITVGDALLGNQDIIAQATIAQDGETLSATLSLAGQRASTPQGLKLSQDRTFEVSLQRGNALVKMFCYLSRY